MAEQNTETVVATGQVFSTVERTREGLEQQLATLDDANHNASGMVVEHADRFGLAALHQLRGRVGRGETQSYCFLVYSEKLTEDAKARLKAMLSTSDGFALAEEDLRIRGPGELAGTAQSGNLRLAIADPVRDTAILEEARADAFALVEQDPGLLSAENTVLREVLARANPFSDGIAGGG